MHSHREKQPQPERPHTTYSTHTLLTTLARMTHTKHVVACFCFASDLRCCSLLSVLVFLLFAFCCCLLSARHCALLFVALCFCYSLPSAAAFCCSCVLASLLADKRFSAHAIRCSLCCCVAAAAAALSCCKWFGAEIPCAIGCDTISFLLWVMGVFRKECIAVESSKVLHVRAPRHVRTLFFRLPRVASSLSEVSKFHRVPTQ